jgi:DNA-binding MarR family transcriptional regulator
MVLWALSWIFNTGRSAATHYVHHRMRRIYEFAYSFLSLYDVRVATKLSSSSSSDPSSLLESLAEFRFELRKFLHFSEEAAEAAGLQPQQHQLLLQVAGAKEGTLVTIAYAAKRLKLRHNSVVELVNRSVREGFLLRAPDADDLRRVLLQITPKGKKVLRKLSIDHARELNELAPRLALDLQRISGYASAIAGDR